jgi:hypothetical protein
VALAATFVNKASSNALRAPPALLSAKLLGASRIILVGHNEARLKLGQKFGATDLECECSSLRI